MSALNEMIDLGPDSISEMNFVKLITDDAGNVVSFATYHISPSGEQCGGLQEINETNWNLVEFDPLTIIPSVNCSDCPSHFTIKHGVLHDDNLAKQSPCEICRERYAHLMPPPEMAEQ